ncbi:MAG: RluA family pseudouridine synthase [Alphaproteobacteria bacterium]|nr:RluA family pseudouridine synthase [Alphaproteobacteria bacterium]
MSGAKVGSATVKPDEANTRLDRWFGRHYPAIKHGQLEKLLRTGQVRVEGKRAKAAQRLEAGQQIRIPPIGAAPSAGANGKGGKPAGDNAKMLAKLRSWILFEDKDVLAINKPAGLAVQGGPGLTEHLDDMLECMRTREDGKPKLVHRLDRETSGVLLLAKNAFSASKLTAAFRYRETSKLYWALTIGVPDPPAGKISAPLIREGERMVVSESEDAQSAKTLYKVVEAVGKKAAFVALSPLSGRTHQLRVHMAYAGTPVAGDKFYGGPVPEDLLELGLAKRLHLHARRLIIPHPRRGFIDVIAPLLPDMQKSWRALNFGTDADDLFTDVKTRRE